MTRTAIEAAFVDEATRQNLLQRLQAAGSGDEAAIERLQALLIPYRFVRKKHHSQELSGRDKRFPMDGVTVINHPLVQHKLTFMRRKETSTAGFRRLLREISTLLCYEVTRDLELTVETIETPMVEMEAPVLEGKKLVFASILRAWRRPRWKACWIWCLRPVSRMSASTAITRPCSRSNITSRPGRKTCRSGW